MSTPETYLDSTSSRSWIGPSDPGELLQQRLEGLRRVRMVVGGISGLFWGSLAFLATLIAWVWVDLVFDLPPALRITAWLTAFGMLAVFAVKVILNTRANARNELLAEELDNAAATGGEIRSGLDMSADQRVGLAPGNAELSKQLADMAVRKASVLVHDVPDQDVAPMTPAFNSAAAVGGSLFVLVIMILIGPRAAWTEMNRFFNPFGDQPAYSQYAFDITTDKTEVLYGEDLEIEATVSGPNVEQLELVLVPPEAARTKNLVNTEPLDVLPMFPDPDGGWHASIANIKEPFDFYLRLRKARSVAYPVTVITVPEIQNVEVEIVAPLYTGLSVYRGKVPANGIEGLPGTEVRMTVSSNRPLSGGELNYVTDDVVEPTPFSVATDPHQVLASFVITETGRVEIQVTDEANQPSTESYSVPIRRLTDHSPMVRMMQPKATSFATPTAVLPIAVAAEDDYGLRSCQLYRSLNNSRFLPTDLEVPEGSPRRLHASTMLPLAEYQLQPGDEIKLFARVEDNDPNGPDAPIGKGAESDVVTVRIISQADFDRVKQQRDGMKEMMNRHQQAQRRMESLADKMQKLAEKLENEPPDSELAEQLRKEMQDLAEQMKKEAEAIKRLGEKPLPLDMDKELSPQMKKMAEQLQKMAEQMQKMAQQPNATNKEAAEEMKKQLEQLKKEQQQHQQEAMEPLRHMEKILPLKQAENEFTQLVQRQRELADRLQNMRDQNAEDDPAMKARMRELEEEQHRVREQLDDLLDRIEEHADGLPDDPDLDELRNTALEFAQAVRESQAGTEMADAEGALTDFNGTKSHDHAESAAQILEGFLAKCQGMGKACKGGLPKFGPSLAQAMENTMEQLAPGMKPGMNPGNKQGIGMGAGAGGGNSSQRSTMQNVGMYGGEPQFDPTNTTMGESESDNIGGVFTDPFAKEGNSGGSGFTASQTNPAFGGADWGVPIQYRRQAGRYLQGLAEDLEE